MLRNLSTEVAELFRDRGPEVRDVEITGVETSVVAGNFDWTLVRVDTDAGVAGIGEAYWGAGVPEIIQSLERTLVGENPLDLDRLFKHMIQATSGAGSLGGSTVTAISGVEIALHDLAGKLLEVPAYQLLGGKYRDEVRVYCDTHAGEHAMSGPDVDAYAPESYAAAAEAVVDEGFDALKFDLDTATGHTDDRMNRHLEKEKLQWAVSVVEEVTETVGNRADVAFDCHWTWSGDSAVRLASALEPYDVWWLEDTVPPENHDVQKTVTQRTETTIAAGENVYRKHGTRRLIEEQAVDVVQPDMPKVGGMREATKIADQADTYYMPFALHNVSSPIGTMAGAHVAAASSNFLALEYHARDVEWWDDLVGESIIEDGRIVVPEKPGIGLDLDMDAVEEHLADGEELFDPA